MATIHQLHAEQPPQGFFDLADFDLFCDEFASDAEHDEARMRVKEKLITLHDEIYPRMRELKWDLYPAGRRQSLVSPARVSEQNPKVERLVLPYGKPELSRQLMSKQVGESFRDLQSNALLEVAIDKDGLTTEMVIADSAWADAMNFRNKALGGSPDKQHLRWLASNLNDFVITFETNSQAVYRAQAARWVNLGVLDTALERFEPRTHTLRVRVSVPPNDKSLARDKLPGYIIDRFGQLAPLYDYLAWSPKNNYVRG
jgi:hypothetical protein